MTMPPEPAYEVGTEALGQFFRTVPAEGRLNEIRLVETAANRQPALAAYVRQPDGALRPPTCEARVPARLASCIVDDSDEAAPESPCANFCNNSECG